MKALILYRSHYGNTRQVAEALAREIAGLSHVAEVSDLRRRLPDLKDIDCVLIGAPTRMGRATWKARWALRCEVQGAKGPLKESETGKAARFAGEFIAACARK